MFPVPGEKRGSRCPWWELPSGPLPPPVEERVPSASISGVYHHLVAVDGTTPETHHSTLGPYADSPLLCLPAGEEKVGELCCQLPRRDPEQASLPAAPSGHHQLRMLEAVVAPAVLDETTLSTDLPPRGPAGLWMKWPPLRGQLWPSLHALRPLALAHSGPCAAPPPGRPCQGSLAAKTPTWLGRRELSSFLVDSTLWRMSRRPPSQQ